jgi:hypothetical protein
MRFLLLFALIQLVLGSIYQEHFSNPVGKFLTPFSYEWVQLLEQFHNTLGNKSKDTECLFKVPKFDCPPFVWHDAIVDRDAYHLRPQVCFFFFFFFLKKWL